MTFYKDSHHFLQSKFFIFFSSAPCFVQCIAYCLKREEAPKGVGFGGFFGQLIDATWQGMQPDSWALHRCFPQIFRDDLVDVLEIIFGDHFPRNFKSFVTYLATSCIDLCQIFFKKSDFDSGIEDLQEMEVLMVDLFVWMSAMLYTFMR